MTSVDTEELPLIELVRPMPGFPDQRSFALVRLDDDGSLFELRSVEDPAVRFLVVAPNVFFPDYAPEVDDDAVRDLGLISEDDALALVIVNPGATLADSTANLLAPVVVNTASRTACQVIMDDDTLSVRTPLVV